MSGGAERTTASTTAAAPAKDGTLAASTRLPVATAGPVTDALPARATANTSAAVPAKDGKLASTRPPATAGPVTDDDPARAALTARLLGQLATQLGFPLADARVRVDDEAARRTDTRGARGLTTGATIWLHPAEYDPRTAGGRALLAHEATHVAQRSATGTAQPLHAAEVEAAAAAAAFAEGRVLSRPSIPLPAGVTAADTGPTTTAPSNAAATLPESTPATAVPTLREAYARDIVAIRHNLDAGFFSGVTEEDVSTVLLLLDQHELGTATAIMREVGPPYRERLADHANDGHRRRHRQAILATYGAMTTEERAHRDAHLFDGMGLTDLPPAEHATVIEVMRNLSDPTLRQLLAGDRRGAVLTLMQTPVDDQAKADEHKATLAALQARVEARPVPDDDKALRELITETGSLLANPNAERAHKALDRLRPLLPAVAEPAPATGGKAPTERPRSAKLTYVVAALEESGAIARLVDAVPDGDHFEGKPYGDAFLEVIRHRPVAANIATVQDRLSFGILDWLLRRRDDKAWLAYQIVRRLPPADQDRWRDLDNGKWFRRLEDNISDARYEGVVVEKDRDGGFVDVASQLAGVLSGEPGRTIWTKIDTARRKGVGAPTLLAMIDAVGQNLPAEANPAELRRAVVHRLDLTRQLDRILAALPDRWLFEIDNLNLLRAVVALRDPAQLRRQVYDLVKRNFWRQLPVLGFLFADFSVSAHEAFVAFQLARLLPPADRAELEASGRWSAMVGALTQEMRMASGMHLAADRDGRERERVVDRLRDNTLWRGDRAAELRAQVNMAIELGLRRFVFDRSRDTRAFEVAELRPMVDRFGLYLEPGRTTYQPERLPPLQNPLLRAGTWLWVKLDALASTLGSVHTGMREVGVVDLDLNKARNLPFVSSLVDTDVVRPADAPNRLTLLYNLDDETLRMDLPELRITSLNQLSAGLGVKAGEITLRGMKVRARFPKTALDKPVEMWLDLDTAIVADLLVTGDNLLVAVATAVLRRLGVHLGRTSVAGPVPQPPGSDYHLPIPVLWPVIELVTNAIRLGMRSGDAKRELTQLQGFEVSVAELRLDGVAEGSGTTARTLAIRDLFVGAGLNSAAYLHALLEVLRRRLRRARPEQRGDLEKRIAKAESALTGQAAADRRLAELHAKYARDPGSLSEAERHEAAALEGALTGGAVLDIGRLELDGLGGDVRFEDAVVNGITGEVESPLFRPSPSVFVTDEERIAEFRQNTPRVPLIATLPARVEDVELSNVRAAGEIPTSKSLAVQLDKLPPGVPEMNRLRLVALLDAVREYEKLVRAQPLNDAGRRLLAAQRDKLRFEFGFRAALVRARGIGADLVLGPGLGELGLGGGAESFTATDVAALGFFHADEVSGTDVGGRVRTPPARRGDPVRQEVTFHAGELRAKGATIDWAGNQARDIGITGVAGAVELERPSADAPPTGVRIPALTVVSASVAGVDYRTATAWVHSEGATQVTGISLSGKMTTVGGRSDMTVDRLHLDRLSADRLVVENNGGGTPFRAEVTSGALLGIDVLDLKIPGGAGLVLPGRAELGGIDQLRVSFVANALSGPVSGSGVLSTVTETGAPRSTGSVVFQKLAGTPKGGEQVDLNGLRFTGTEIRTPNGHVVIRKLGIGASVHHRAGEDTWTVRSFDVPELRLGALRWRAGDGTEVTSTGGATLLGLTANGYVVAPKGKPRRVHVDELSIDSIAADSLRFRQDPIDIVLGPPSPVTRPGGPPLEIRAVRLRDLDWTPEEHFKAGTLDIGSAGIAFGGLLAAHLRADTTLALTSVHASFLKGDRLVLRARGSADANVQWWDMSGRTTKELSTHVAVNELDTGDVEIGPGAIEFGHGDAAGLRIADITVDKIDYQSTDLALTSMAGGRGAVVRHPRGKVRIELRDAAERAAAGGPATSAIKRILVREIGIEAIEMDGVHVTLPNLVAPDPGGAAHPVELWLPPGETAVVRDIRLVLPAEGLAITPPDAAGKAWTIPELNLQITGQTADGGQGPAVLVPSLRAKIAGVLDSATARAEIQRVEVGLLSGGGVTVDLRRPSVTAIEALLPGHRLRFRGLAPLERPEAGGVRAERVQLDSRTGALTISDLGANRLRYENEDLGLEVEVDRATVPGDVKATLPAPGRPLSGDYFKQLSIEGAWFRVDFEAMRRRAASKKQQEKKEPPPSQKPWTDLLAKLGPAERVLDTMQGRIGLTVHLDLSGVKGALAPTDIPVDLRLADGRLDYQAITKQLKGRALNLLMFDLRPKASELRLVLPPLVGGADDASGYQDRLIPIAIWRLPTAELADAEENHRVRLWRLLDTQGLVRDALLDKQDTPEKDEEKEKKDPIPVTLRDIDMDVALRSAIPVEINLPALSDGKITGTVTLARGAIANVRMAGNLPGVLAQGPSDLAHAEVAGTDLRFGGGGVSTGQITVDDLHDLQFVMGQDWSPTVLSGRIRRATATGIHWRLP